MSKVLIGRQTLALIGRPSIESFTENSPGARQMATWYDPCRKECLSSHNFSFARKTEALALHTVAATNSWAYRYVMPSNCLYVWKVFAGDAKKAQPFEISLVGEELTIMTNVEAAYVQFTFDLEVTDLFTPNFTKALRYLLAHYIAPTLNGTIGVQMSDKYLQAHRLYLLKAAAEDGNGELPREEEEPAVLSQR